MKATISFALPLLLVVALAVSLPAADDTVIIPKSKLEELERKAAELEKLQKQLEQSQGETERLQKEKAAAEARAAAEAKAAAQAKADAEKSAAAAKSAEQAKAAALAAVPPPAHVAPAIATLPPLKEGDIVNSMDLFSHYATDPVAAKQRYEQHDITVEGEIVGFSKPLFVRPYRVLLKTGDPAKRVCCTLFPPNRYKAVYTIKNGTQLVGLTKDREAEVPLLRVGQTVEVQGSCRGADEAGVNLSTCELKAVR